MKFQSTSRSKVSECQQISVYFCQWSQKLCSIRAIILTKKPCAVHTFFKTQSHTMLSCNFCIKKVHHFKPDISIHMQHAKNKYTFVYIICSTFFTDYKHFPVAIFLCRTEAHVCCYRQQKEMPFSKSQLESIMRGTEFMLQWTFMYKWPNKLTGVIVGKQIRLYIIS